MKKDGRTLKAEVDLRWEGEAEAWKVDDVDANRANGVAER